MHKLVKELALTTALMGVGVISLSQQPISAQAAVKTHKLKSIPKRFRGTWYQTSKGKTYKLKVSAKRFGISKYRHTRDKNSAAYSSEQYFTPYKVTGAKSNTLYLVNGVGGKTVRQTTIKHHKALIYYNEQEHGNSVYTLTKSKKSSVQKSWGAGNPYGMSVTSVKTAKQNRRDFAKINPYIKKYFGKVVKKKSMHGNGPYKHINVTYYTFIKDPMKLK
ncbi:hypothetical protein [Lactiplantibacillus paraxiangfangensis]|uniref:hypothetical protein n=1 Tax=Lactiplantibacillus paraxiangfangensis TaxID=3076224 RepID=UPI0030C67BB9